MNIMPWKDKDGKQVAKGGKSSWRLRWERKDPGTGKRCYIYETFHGSHREAERYWIRQQAAIDRAGAAFVAAERTPLAEFLTSWMRDYVDVHCKPSTAKSYREIVELHVMPALGAVSLRDLTPAKVSEWQARVARKTKKSAKAKDDGKPAAMPQSLSPRRVAYIRVVLHAAMEEALRLGLIPANPVDRVRPPKQAPKQVEAFSPEEIGRLLGAAKGHRLAPLFDVAWQTGLRTGELLALRWQDVDFGSMAIRVQQNAVYLGKGRMVTDLPKTDRGRRTVAMTAAVASTLEAHRGSQAAEQMDAGEAWQDCSLVFCTSQGKPLLPANVRRDFYRIEELAGLPKRGLHSLRHTKATFARAAGVDLADIADDLGHASPYFTARQYAHVLPETRRRAADRFEEYVQLRVKQGVGYDAGRFTPDAQDEVQ